LRTYTLSVRAPFAECWKRSRHETLAAALGAAWRRRRHDYSVDGVTCESKVVISHEAMELALAEMDELLSASPKRRPLDLAAVVIRKMEAAITSENMWENIELLRAANASVGGRLSDS
jgi:hypothetical protein